jgi:hypothetical protein
VPEKNTLWTKQPTGQNMQMVAEKRRGSNDSYIGIIEFAFNHRSRPLG